METKKPKIFVGILVMTKVKLYKDLPEELVALFQRRGKINTENDDGFKWQSYPGLCEVTSYGKAEIGEDAEEAVKREVSEELGGVACKEIFKSKLIKIYENTEADGDKQIIWTTILPKEVLKNIKLDISTGGIEIIRKSDLQNIKEVKFSSKKSNIKSSDDITLFETPVSAVKKAFEIFE
jgi:hypothetical protein